MISFRRFIKGILLKGETSDPSDNLEGSIFHNSTSSRIKTYIESAVREVTTNDQTQTLQNKTLDNTNAATLTDTNLTIQDNGDATKQVQFNASDITAGQTRTFTLPDENTTLLGTATTQTVTNKSIDADNNTITNIDNADIKAGAAIDAAKIHDGSVSNTEFGYLDGVTSGIQGQLDAKAEISGATDNRIVKTDGAADIQQTGITIDDSDNITGVNGITTTGNVTVGGDLQVNGTTTSVNSTTLEVTDANVTVNNGGNQAAANAQGAGLTVEMSDATDATISYDSTLASKFKIGESGSEVEITDVSSSQTITNKTIDADNNTISNLAHGAEVDNPTSGVHGVTGDVVGTTDTQALTNKDIDGGTASNTSRVTIPQDTISNLEGLTRKEGTLVYANDLDRFYGDDGTSLFEIGSGQGVKNYIEDNNSTFETPTNDWFIYKSATANYEDGISVTGSTQITKGLTTTAAEVLQGSQSFVINKPANDTSGEGVSVNSITIDRVDRGKALPFIVSIDASAMGSVGDWELRAYDVTNSQILYAGTDENLAISPNKSRKSIRVFTENTTEQVRLSIHCKTTDATAYEIYIDEVVLQRDELVPGAIIGELEDISVTINNLPTSSVVSKGRRVGNHLELFGTVTASGAATGTISISLNDLTIDGTALGGDVVIGTGGALDTTGGTNYHVGAANYVDGVENIQFYGDGLFVWGATVPYTWASGDLLRFHLSVPIEEWSAGAQISTTEAAFTTVNAVARTTGATSFPNTVATKVLNLGVQDQSVGGVIDTTNDRILIPKTGYYLITGQIRFAVSSGRITLFTQRNNDGVSLARTDVEASATNAEPHARVTAIAKLDAGDYLELFCIQSSGGSINNVASIAGGATNTFFSITELPDFSVFGTYGTFEIIEAVSSTASAVSSGSSIPLTGNGVTLPPGTWKLSGSSRYGRTSGNNTILRFRALWSLTQNSFTNIDTITSGDILSKPLNGAVGDLAYDAERTLNSLVCNDSQLIVKLTSETTFYLNIVIDAATVTNKQGQVSIVAERLQ